MLRPIAISLSPNTEYIDIQVALRTIFLPNTYIHGDAVTQLEQWFHEYFKVKNAVSFLSGRAALYSVLKGLHIKEKDEVILQAFTCVAVPNAIIWAGAKPVYVDITESLTIDVKDLERKITKHTKAIIIQHTFAIPNNVEKIVQLAKKKGIFTIEDCAHGIGVTYNNKKLGTFGDCAIFSFGRDKAFSSVFGGMVITNNQALAKNISLYQESLLYPKKFWIFQQLFHPIVFLPILPLYNFYNVGKILLVILQKISLLSFPVTQKEKKSEFDESFLKKMPNALASLALKQLERIDMFNKKRETISQIYIDELSSFYTFPKTTLPYLRFPVLTKRRDEIISLFKQQGILIGKWYSEIIDPKGVDVSQCYYVKGSCPQAERISKNVLNLPTYPTLNTEDAQKIVSVLNRHVKS